MRLIRIEKGKQARKFALQRGEQAQFKAHYSLLQNAVLNQTKNGKMVKNEEELKKRLKADQKRQPLKFCA